MLCIFGLGMFKKEENGTNVLKWTFPHQSDHLNQVKNPFLKFKQIKQQCQAKLANSNRGLYHKNYYGCNLRFFIISSSVCPWQVFPTWSSV
jgi:hypothetical protein